MNRRTLCLFALLPALSACASLNRDPAAEPVRVVFFEEDRDTLDGPARAVVQEAAEAAARFSAVRVNVFGYAGPVGGAGFNRALSEARARHVADSLRQFGVPADRVFILGRGEVPFAMAPIESRRVEIRLAPP